MDFGGELQFHLNLTASLGIFVRHIEKIQETITSLQMDVALLDSERGELRSSDESPSANHDEQRGHLLSEIAELRGSLNHEYRKIYGYVNTYQNNVHHPALKEYYNQLDQLFSKYVDAITSTP